MSSGDYPPGANQDSRAPWKEEEIDCPYCDGSGETGDSDDLKACPLCQGKGTVDQRDPEVKEYYQNLSMDYYDNDWD